MEYDLRPGGAFRARATPPLVAMGMPDVVVDGEVIEVDPPRRLVQTYRFLFSEEMKAEGYVTHELEGAPTMAFVVSSRFSEMGTGGWVWILSDLKSLLETGSRMG